MKKETVGKIRKTKDGPNLSQSPGFLIRRLQQVAVSIFIQTLYEYGITPIQYTILRVVQRHPETDQASLAALSYLDTSTVMDVLRRLEMRKLISRSIDPQDRRKRRVSLTAQGRSLLDEVEPQVNRSRARLLSPLTATEKDRFLATIRKILEAHENSSSSEVANRPWRRFNGIADPVR